MDRGNVAIDRNAYAPSRLGEMESMVEVLGSLLEPFLETTFYGNYKRKQNVRCFYLQTLPAAETIVFEQGYPFTKQSASVGLHLSWSTTQPQKHHHGKHQRLKRLIFPSLWISTRVLEQKLLWVQLRLDLIFRGRVAVDFFPSESFLITFSPSSQHAWCLSVSHYMFSSR